MTPEEKVALLKEARVWDVIGYPTCIDKLFDLVAARERQKFMALCEAEYKKYDELVTEEDAGHEEATAIIHLMRKLEGMK